MIGRFLNSLTGSSARKEEREKELHKRKILSKHSVYGSEDYELRAEAYDKDAGRSRDAAGYHKNNLYGQ